MPDTPMVDWNSLAPAYDRHRSYDLPAEDFWLATMVRAAGIRRASHVLDLGAGTGTYAYPLAQHLNADVVALEPSEDMLLRGQARHPELAVRWCLAGAEAIPLESGSVDHVF